MDNLKRVDIKVPEELLKFAAVKAAMTGISRRQYIANIVIDTLEHVKAFSDAWDQVKDRPVVGREYPLSVTECTTTKPE